MKTFSVDKIRLVWYCKIRSMWQLILRLYFCFVNDSICQVWRQSGEKNNELN